MRNLLISVLIGICSFLTACATQHYYPVTENVALSQEAAQNIAADFTQILSQHFAAGQTTFIVSSQDKPLNHALESALRNRGYGIDTDTEMQDGVRLGYIVDSLN